MPDGSAWEREGREWLRQCLTPDELSELAAAFDYDGQPGVRLSVSDPALIGTAAWGKLLRVARDQIPDCRPVRVVAFDKTEHSNWSLPWHQDRVIAVPEKHEVGGFSTWSRKGDVWHCEPPLPFLDRMMFARVHIDAADETNGGLELALGTHRLGRISAGEVHWRAQEATCEMCVAEAGDVLLAKALILHRSQSSSVIRQRRAVRIDFSSDHLPPPLHWAD